MTEIQTLIMDKKQLDPILKKAYNPLLWRRVLTDVFGARNLNQTPQKILLPQNELADNAFELGFFNTTDDRIIGLYQIDLKENVKIERNKVSLRELLRNIYKYDVDGALVVFVQGEKWRLSFISEIRVLNDDGTIEKKATEPKRYTYLLGKNEKTKTPTDRLSLLTNKKIALEDIRAAFSVEALNNEFYKQISEYFYQLVGATTTKGKKTEVREKIMNLPGVAADDRKTYQEFAVRLIGRTVFCWFLREKKSEQNKALLPEKLLSSDAVRANNNYYHEILEFLFFQTLNTPMDKRIANLPAGCETVPFLNGGLFEPQNEDHYDSKNKTKNYQNYELKIPDKWFEKFFEKLEEYNFTIDENSPTEVEISVDPEMLGRIFENLLAEIDPDSGETARKATGSFYTPREIVNYMVDESLLIYLKSKLQTETQGFIAFGENQSTLFGNEMRVQPMFETALNENRWQGKDGELETELRKLFSYSDNENPFNETETEILIKAIDNCKILDPACGSGAFPIGVLQRLVHLLGKLDADGSKWKQWLKKRAIDETANAFDEGDVEQRNVRLRQISEAFEKDSSDFGRKLFLIENCIYGVDIQPIAAEISKLRCFLTLIVDDTIDENKPNRGVNPLPNLEFKFVTADALLKLPESKQINLFNSDTRLSELERIRHEYINSFGAKKEAAKFEYEVIRKSIENDHENNAFKDERSITISKWNPFGHKKVDWFDSEWMFGVKAFDIVIGNPPYKILTKNNTEIQTLTKYLNEYKTVKNSSSKNIYVLFIESAIQTLINKYGFLSFIVPEGLFSTRSYSDCVEMMKSSGSVTQIVKFKSFVFENAVTGNLIFVYSNNIQNEIKKLIFDKNYVLSELIDIDNQILEKMNKAKTKPLQSICSLFKGMVVGDRNTVVGEDKSFGLDKFLLGKSIKKWEINKLFYTNYDTLKIIGGTKRKSKHDVAPRLLIRRTGDYLCCSLLKKPALTESTLYSCWSILTEFENTFLLGVLNSKLLTYYIRQSMITNQQAFPQILMTDLETLPIATATPPERSIISNLVDYILFLKETDAAEQVNEYVPNSHLVEQFEEVIDALVYELYFEEDFQRAEIHFHKYASRDFPSIEGLNREEKIKIIHAAYQTLRQKDGEIRNNLKLMDIRLADLIMPIKTAQ